MQYGVDVAITRLDDLDRRVLHEVSACVRAGLAPQVLDAGCGGGGLSVPLAVAGAAVTALDIVDCSTAIREKLSLAGCGDIHINSVTADIYDWVTTTHVNFNIVVLQRVLHYLPYEKANVVLRQLRERTEHLFLSVTGTTTAIAGHYPSLALPVTERFGLLDSAGQELFSITAPLCLYHERELRELLHNTGWNIVWSRVSDFGNIKIEAVT